MYLDEYLQKNNLSSRKFALRADIDPVVIQHYFKKGRDMRLSSVAKIVQATKGQVSVSELDQYATAMRDKMKK